MTKNNANGVIERQGNSRPAVYIIPSPGLLDIGVQLEEAGVEPTVGYEAAQIMRRRLSPMADELVGFFAERAGQGFGGHGEPREIGRSFEALRPEGMRAVQLIFAQEMERSLRDFVEKGGAMPTARRSKSSDSRSRRSESRSESRSDSRSDARSDSRSEARAERDRKAERRAERHDRRPGRSPD